MEKKLRIVGVRVTEEQHAAILEYAERRRMTVSAVVKQSLTLLNAKLLGAKKRPR
jgi:hypothetical protein